jgi:hypothetical protein
MERTTACAGSQGIYITFQSGEYAGMFKWQPPEDISYNSGKEVEFMINSEYRSYALAKHC